jgi:hypothetical protein
MTTTTPQSAQQTSLSVPGATVDFPDRKGPPIQSVAGARCRHTFQTEGGRQERFWRPFFFYGCANRAQAQSGYEIG